jgi:hypothetical protein
VTNPAPWAESLSPAANDLARAGIAAGFRTPAALVLYVRLRGRYAPLASPEEQATLRETATALMADRAAALAWAAGMIEQAGPAAAPAGRDRRGRHLR